MWIMSHANIPWAATNSHVQLGAAKPPCRCAAAVVVVVVVAPHMQTPLHSTKTKHIHAWKQWHSCTGSSDASRCKHLTSSNCKLDASPSAFWPWGLSSSQCILHYISFQKSKENKVNHDTCKHRMQQVNFPTCPSMHATVPSATVHWSDHSWAPYMQAPHEIKLQPCHDGCKLWYPPNEIKLHEILQMRSKTACYPISSSCMGSSAGSHVLFPRIASWESVGFRAQKVYATTTFVFKDQCHINQLMSSKSLWEFSKPTRGAPIGPTPPRSHGPWACCRPCSFLWFVWMVIVAFVCMVIMAFVCMVFMACVWCS